MNAFSTAFEHPLGFGSIRYMHFLDEYNIGSHDTYSQTFIRLGALGLGLWLFLISRQAMTNFPIALVVSLGAITNNIFIVPR